MATQQDLQLHYSELGALEKIRRRRFLWQLALFRNFKNDMEKELWQATAWLARLFFFIAFAVISILFTLLVLLPLNRVILPNSLGLIGNTAISNVALGLFNLLFVLLLGLLAGLMARITIHRVLNKRINEVRKRIMELQQQLAP